MYGGGKDGGPGLADLNAQMRQLSAALVQASVDAGPAHPPALLCASCQRAVNKDRSATSTPAHPHSQAQPPTEDITVADANSAWLHSRYSLQPGFAEALQAAFGVDAARPLTTAAAINGWVSDATRGKIKDIVDEGAVAQASHARLSWSRRHGRRMLSGVRLDAQGASPACALPVLC